MHKEIPSVDCTQVTLGLNAPFGETLSVFAEQRGVSEKSSLSEELCDAERPTLNPQLAKTKLLATKMQPELPNICKSLPRRAVVCFGGWKSASPNRCKSKCRVFLAGVCYIRHLRYMPTQCSWTRYAGGVSRRHETLFVVRGS